MIDTERLERQIEFARGVFSKNAVSACDFYQQMVTVCATRKISILGVVDNPELLDFLDEPKSKESINAHARLRKYVADAFDVKPEDISAVKEAMIEAMNPFSELNFP